MVACANGASSPLMFATENEGMLNDVGTIKQSLIVKQSLNNQLCLTPLNRVARDVQHVKFNSVEWF